MPKKGYKQTEEHIEKCRLLRVGKRKGKNYIELFGNKKSKIWKKNISNGKKGKYCKNGFKKGMTPWNYIDGRSKMQNWNRYGSNWKNIRKQVLKRDNHQCQLCGKFEGRLEIHHKIPFMKTQDNSLNNLVTLCAKCHRFIENKMFKKLDLYINQMEVKIWQ